MEPEKKRFFRLGVTLFCSLTAVILFYFILLRVDGVKAYLSVIVNLFMGIAVAVYLLISRERYLAQCRKLFCAVSRNQRFNRLVMESVQEAHHIFGGFISGKLLDSLIIGILCYIGLLIMKMPYTALISVVIGVPLLATLYYLVKRAAEWSLNQQGLPVETSAYGPKDDREEDKL